MKRIKITKQLITGALVYHCPCHQREGCVNYCVNLFDGKRSNCNGETCSYVNDFFRTMAKIANNEIEID